jgi:hypothetical protein
LHEMFVRGPFLTSWRMICNSQFLNRPSFRNFFGFHYLGLKDHQKRAISNGPLCTTQNGMFLINRQRDDNKPGQEESLIDNCGTDGSWPSNLEMGWGIWLGDDKIWFWGRQHRTAINERAGLGCRQGVA